MRQVATGHRAGVRRAALGLRPGAPGPHYRLSAKQRALAVLRGHRIQKRRDGRKGRGAK